MKNRSRYKRDNEIVRFRFDEDGTETIILDNIDKIVIYEEYGWDMTWA